MQLFGVTGDTKSHPSPVRQASGKKQNPPHLAMSIAKYQVGEKALTQFFRENCMPATK
jgi:hypothetical protein